ncbi:MAG: hypothetical protein C0472_14525 [Erythrobacter sp.]|nr:hypothetical protein [Erythrobacter sp.]MBA4172366.1 hypothetical protein [Hyphomicrobium sp.]
METIALPGFVVAPEARGRGYAVSMPGSWTLNLAMMMLAWSQLLIEEEFAASIDIGPGGLLVCRGRFIKQLPSGDAVAVLVGVVVSDEQLARIGYRTDRLAASLPEPAEGSTFGQSPHIFTLPGERDDAAPWPELRLAWCDRYVECLGECDRMELLHLAMDSIEPAPQRARIRSWATTDTLPARGSIDPMGQTQLLFGTNPARAPKRFLAAQVRGTRADDGVIVHEVTHVEPAPIPESFDTHADMRALAAQHAAIDGEAPELAWNVQLATLLPQDVAEKLALELAGKQKLSATLRLLEAMIDHPRPAIRAGGEAAALKVLDRLAQRGPLPDKALPLIGKLAGNPDVFGAVLGKRELKHENTNVTLSLAEIANRVVRGELRPESPVRSSLSAFTIELAQLSVRHHNFIESALTIGQSWPKDSLGEIADMLTTETATAFAEQHGPEFRLLTRKLMDSGFLDLATMKDVDHALRRVAGAFVSRDCLTR